MNLAVMELMETESQLKSMKTQRGVTERSSVSKKSAEIKLILNMK